jgi:hypothetical protein
MREDQGTQQKIESGKGGIILRVYTRKYSAIASGATTIESARHAPDDIIKSWFDLMT